MKGETSIAIYHLSIKIISRGKGKSAVAAAAYRAGEKITNHYDGISHDYTRKKGVAHAEILLPEHAPREFSDRAVLWNAVEKIEKNKNAQLSREVEIALPVELSAGQNLSLVREYCNEHFVSKGMCADICIHDTGTGNPHAHIMLTMRPFEPDGAWAAKSKKEYLLDENGERIRLKNGDFKTRKINTVDWNDQTKAEEWRQGWADICNQFLEQNNHAERIDHRSYERQGVEQIPTIHMGVVAFQMEKRGIVTERGNINRQVASMNQELRQLRARINKLKSWLEDESKSAVPNLQTVISAILDGSGDKTRWQKTADLKTAAKILAFLQANGITTVPELRQKIMDMHGQRRDINDKINKIERRLKTLAEHIKQSEIYARHKDIHRLYKNEKPNARDVFYQARASELVLFEAAGKYLKDHLNGRNQIPLVSWKSEAEELTAERETLYREYYRLKEEVKEVEAIRRNAELAVRDEPGVNNKRTNEVEL